MVVRQQDLRAGPFASSETQAFWNPNRPPPAPRPRFSAVPTSLPTGRLPNLPRSSEMNPRPQSAGKQKVRQQVSVPWLQVQMQNLGSGPFFLALFF